MVLHFEAKVLRSVLGLSDFFTKVNVKVKAASAGEVFSCSSCQEGIDMGGREAADECGKGC